MKVCKQCGQSVQDVETYCPRCGSGQLIPDTAQRTQQRPQQPQQRARQDMGGMGAPSQARQPQQAPPGYRNPNSVNMNQQRPVQRPPQQRPPQRPPQGQVPPQRQQNFQNQAPQQRPVQQVQQDDYGFGVQETPEVVQGKKKLGFGKKNKQQVQQPMQQPVQQQAQPNQAYGMPYDTSMQGNVYGGDETVTIKEWFIMLLKLMIPIYNIIFIIGAWKGKGVKPSMQNYIKVYTIMLGISLVLVILINVVIMPLILSMMW